MSNRPLDLTHFEEKSPLQNALETAAKIIEASSEQYRRSKEVYEKEREKRAKRQGEKYLRETLKETTPEENPLAFTKRLVDKIPEEQGVLEAALNSPAYKQYMKDKIDLQKTGLSALGKQADYLQGLHLGEGERPRGPLLDAIEDVTGVTTPQDRMRQRGITQPAEPMRESPQIAPEETTPTAEPTMATPSVAPRQQRYNYIQGIPQIPVYQGTNPNSFITRFLRATAEEEQDQKLARKNLPPKEKQKLLNENSKQNTTNIVKLHEGIEKREVLQANLNVMEQLALTPEIDTMTDSQLIRYLFNNEGYITDTFRSWVLGGADNRTQLFEKFSKQLFQNVREFFGGGARILQSELQIFDKTIPTLGNSATVIQLLTFQAQQFNDIALLSQNMRSKLISQNPELSGLTIDDLVKSSLLDQKEAFKESMSYINEISGVFDKAPDAVVVYSPKAGQEKFIQDMIARGETPPEELNPVVFVMTRDEWDDADEALKAGEFNKYGFRLFGAGLTKSSITE